jgi:hypothetical protein
VASKIIIVWLPFIALVAIWVGAIIWTKRRFKNVPELPAQIEGPADSITIARERQYPAFLRDLIVLVDGAPAGAIGPGKVIHLRVQPGPHTVAMKIDWCTSTALSIEKRAGDNLILRTGIKSSLAPFYRPREYTYVQNDG